MAMSWGPNGSDEDRTEPVPVVGRSKAPFWGKILFAALGIVLVLGIVGIVTSGTAPSEPDAVPVAAPAPAEPAPGPLETFGNGTWVVGRDVNAGSYRSPGPEPAAAPLCYFALRPGPGSQEFADQGTAPEGPSTVELADGQELTSRGCLDWVRVSS